MTDTPDPPLPPQCAALYTVQGRLGSGGQGVVYLALQVALQRQVALKVLLVDDPDFQARFRQEALVAARLRHPNLVAVLDHGVENARSWLALEYVEGPSLRKQLSSGPLPWREALRIGAGLARGLAALHESGVVHRDVKPENVLLGEAGPKITDFGLARHVDGSGVGTQSGVVMGTPAYIAPEVILGARAGTPADVYGLGSVLYEMIAGQTPFDADRPLLALRAQLEPLDAAQLARLPTPRPVRDLISRCLSKDETDRPSAADLETALLDLANAPHVEGPRQTKAVNLDTIPGVTTGTPPRPTLVNQRAAGPARGRSHGVNRPTARLAPEGKDRAASRATARPAKRSVRIAAAVAAGAGLLAVVAAANLIKPRGLPPIPAVFATPAVPGVDYSRLDAHADQLFAAIDRSTTAMRAWEIAATNAVASGMETKTARDLLVDFKRRAEDLNRFDAELARLARPDDLALQALRAQVHGMLFELWFWRGWSPQYLRSGETFFPGPDLLFPQAGERARGGKPVFFEFSGRLYKLLHRAAARPEFFDARLARALFQVSRAYRYLRAARDVHLFDEPTLPADLNGWLANLKSLPAPQGHALAAIAALLAKSAVDSGDARKLLPDIRTAVERYAKQFPEASGWPQIVACFGPPR